jgi:hypothetical protein
MLFAKGHYEWKLINKNTGEVELTGEQDNLITDTLHDLTVAVHSNIASYNWSRMTIKLSDSILSPAIDYRVRGEVQLLNFVATSSQVNNTYAYPEHQVSAGFNFIPGASARTIRVISIDIVTGSENVFYNLSFIELSTPITQNTDQYLYVKYTITLSYTPSLGSPVNNWATQVMRTFRIESIQKLHQTIQMHRLYNFLNISPFKVPEDVNNMMTSPFSVAPTTNAIGALNTGARYGRGVNTLYSITDFIGVIKSVVFGNTTFGRLLSLGYSSIPGLSPAISRVFAHPLDRREYLFSDPSYPPSSLGSVAITGTPTNDWPIVGRVIITKTGDASDVVDDTFSVTGAPTDTFATGSDQGHAVGDIVRFTTTDTLPDPLAEDTNYYVVYKSGTSMKVSATSGGSAISLTDAGSGTHAIIRWNTGKYRLALEPFIGNQAARAAAPGSNLPDKFSYLYETPYMMLNEDNDPVISPSTGTPQNGQNPSMMYSGIYGLAKVGKYLWMIQRPNISANTGRFYIVRWLFGSIENGIYQNILPATVTTVWCMATDGTYFYIATNEGIYKYDPADPTTAPELMSITGIISDTNITDLAYDQITGYLWAGHGVTGTFGLSRIDLSALTAVDYIVGVGEELEGMASSAAEITTGQLYAYNGRVSRSGRWGYVAGGVSNWVLQDGAGWCTVHTFTAGRHFGGGAIREGTDEMVYFGLDASNRGEWKRYSVTVTGKNSGTVNLLATVQAPATPLNSVAYKQQVRAMTPNLFSIVGYITNIANSIQVYDINTGVASIPHTVSLTWDALESAPNYALGRVPIYIGDANEKLALTIADFSNSLRHPILQGARYIMFGWTGTTWAAENTTERYIPKTGSHALLHGISGSFNNAAGENWNEQFIEDESFNFIYGKDCLIKDNLQTFRVKGTYYLCKAVLVEDDAVVVPSASGYALAIAERTDPDFRDMDVTDYQLEVKEGTTVYTMAALPSTTTCSASSSTDQLTVSTNIPTGTPVYLTSAGYWDAMPIPLWHEGIYFAINIDATHIKLAKTYDDAIAGTAIDLRSNGTSTLYYRVLYATTLATETYWAGSTGFFVFASADAAANVTLSYTYTMFNN